MQDPHDTTNPTVLARDEILEELWVIVNDREVPGNVKVAALDKIARIEGAYKPLVIETTKKFQTLADFYADVHIPDDVEEELDEDAE